MGSEVVGRIDIITSEKPLPGYKYEVDIAFDGKPDYTKVVDEIIKVWHLKSPDSSSIWDQIILEARRNKDYDLFKVVEPVKSKITNVVLLAVSAMEKVEWYRVKLFIINEEPLDTEEVLRDIEKVLEKYFGDGTIKGHLRFVDMIKLVKFPGEGRVISKKTVSLTRSMFDRNLKYHV